VVDPAIQRLVNRGVPTVRQYQRACAFRARRRGQRFVNNSAYWP
jgi:hypothetical protein